MKTKFNVGNQKFINVTSAKITLNVSLFIDGRKTCLHIVQYLSFAVQSMILSLQQICLKLFSYQRYLTKKALKIHRHQTIIGQTNQI